MGKRKTFYMHTFEAQPAMFVDGQICWGYGPRDSAIQLRSTLKQIRRDQRVTKKHKNERGWKYTAEAYSYVRVVLPE